MTQVASAMLSWTILFSANSEDAKFMLVSCSAFANYLFAKAAKAGISLG
jgi:hypothetical protein